MVDECGYCPISLERSSDFSVEILPLNSEGEESCWRWGTKKLEDNNNPNSMESDIVAKLKTTGEYGVYEKYRKGTYKAKNFIELVNGQVKYQGEEFNTDIYSSWIAVKPTRIFLPRIFQVSKLSSIIPSLRLRIPSLIS